MRQDRSPSVSELSFECPRCGAFARQYWHDTRALAVQELSAVGRSMSTMESRAEMISGLESPMRAARNSLSVSEETIREGYKRALAEIREPKLGGQSVEAGLVRLENVSASRCDACGRLSIWVGETLAAPLASTAPLASSDMPEEVRLDYEEAREVLDRSPRGAAALLRLAVEKLCTSVGAEGSSLNAKIGDLVGKGLPKDVSQALDYVRVIGNEAVHPGQIDLRDDRKTAEILFRLVNTSVEFLITRVQELAGIRGIIPEETRKAIDTRNAKALKK